MHAGKPFIAVESADVTSIDGMPGGDLAVTRRLLRVWRDKYPRNVLRSAYYDARNRFRDYGISIPPNIRSRAGNVVGWAQKSVRALSDKSVFRGFATPDGDPDGVADICAANRLATDVGEAIVSCYKHSCSFLTVDLDPDEPEPTPLVVPRSADWSAGLWDPARRRMEGALTITDDDENGRITAFTVWLPGRNWECHRVGGEWVGELHETVLRGVGVVPFVYDAQMDRPFGRSRINRSLMALIDMAFRTMVRMEATAEFYSAPRLWFLGLDPDAFTAGTWKSLVSSVNAVSRDEDGLVPEMRQVTQASMQPHGDMLETIAMLASAETDIPAERLGIRLSNPTSAEALAASENELTRVADRQNVVFGDALMQAMRMAVQLRNGTTDVPALEGVSPVWAPTRVVSDAARADFYTKVASVNQAYAGSDVALRRLGLDEAEIAGVRSREQEQRAQANLDALRQSIAQGGAQQTQAGEEQHEQTAQSSAQSSGTGGCDDASKLKTAFDALGVAIRSGVSPQSAASKLGLDGIDFTGMVPVSLRDDSQQ